MLTAFVDTGDVQKVSNSWRAGKQKDDALDEGPGSGNAVDPESRLAHRPETLRSIISTGVVVARTRTKVRAAGQSDECPVQNSKRKISILLSLGSNQKPSGCLDLAVITAERATNCATEDGGNAASVDRTQYLQKSQDWILQDSK